MNILKALLLTLASFSCLTLNVSGQGQKLIAEKIDEYSDEANCESWAAILDMYSSKLLANATAKGYIIIYPGRDMIGVAAPHFASIRKYITENRGVNTDRIVILKGSRLEKLKVELWYVPVGAEPPKREVGFLPRDEHLPIKYFISYANYPSVPYEDPVVGECLFYQPMYDDFAKELKNKPDSIGLFILYKAKDENKDEYIFDIDRKHLAAELREIMVRRYKIRNDRIKIILAKENLEYPTQEMWIVLRGTSLPTPKKGNKNAATIH